MSDAPTSNADLLAKYPEPPTLDEFRKMYPQYDNKSDGVIADKLYDVYADKLADPSDPFAHPRIAFYAKIGYDPYGIADLPHDLGQLLTGATFGATEPLTGEAQTHEDKENRKAGEEIGAIVAGQAASGMLGLARGGLPPGRITPRWTPPASQLGGPVIRGVPVAQIISHPLVKLGIALGGGATGTYATLKRLGIVP